MSNVMTHKGYEAKVEYSEDDACFFGRIAGVRAIVGFHGDSNAGLRKAFHAAVDNYVALALQRGDVPEKPFSGRMMLRLPSHVHARVSAAADRVGVSVNQINGRRRRWSKQLRRIVGAIEVALRNKKSLSWLKTGLFKYQISF